MPPTANTPTPVRKQSKRRSNLFTVSVSPGERSECDTKEPGSVNVQARWFRGAS